MSSSKKTTSKQPAKEVRQYTTGDPVLGKMRGYPPWPGIIVDPADAPLPVQQQQPNKKASAYCILFFPMGDYGWLYAKELSFLQRHEIEAFLADDAKKRNGDLREGYRIALDPQPWLAARIAAEAAQQDAEENAQVDELAGASDEEDVEGVATTPEGEDDEAGGAKKSRKRKRESEAAEGGKPKKEKAPAKPRLSTAGSTKKGSAEPKVKKSASMIEKKPRKSKSKAVVESEDEGGASAAVVPGGKEDDGALGPLSAVPAASNRKDVASPPPAKKARRDTKEDEEDAKTSGDPQSIKVRDWRHKLQKTFLSAKSPPKPEVMAECDALFTTVEQYDEITIEQLQFSKIGKVMRHIAALPDEKAPPREEDFMFRQRARSLVDKWQRILNANKAGAGGSPEETKEKEKSRQGGNEKVNGNDKREIVKMVEEGVAGVNLNGKGIDSPTMPTIAPATGAESEALPAVADPASPTAPIALGAADAEGEHDQDANAEAEDASMHVEDVAMADA